MKNKRTTRRQFIKGGLLTLGGFIATYPVLFERYGLSVNEYDIPIPGLPREFEGYKILHFTDLHYGFLNPRLIVKSIVDMANSAGADIIACTGDYVKKRNTAEELRIVWPELMRLEARDGVYITLGNHDHWADHTEVLKLLEESGRSLRHKRVKIERNGRRIWFAGTGDLWEDKIGLDEALAGIPENDCRIVLAHNPDTADINFSGRVDLMLSGHTHGGQVVLPLVGAPILPVNNKEYSQGFVKGKNCNVFISRGIGASNIPVRFNCAPELALLKLKCI